MPGMTTTPEARGDWKWLEGTYWYCPAECLRAIRSQRRNAFDWYLDQTVWNITGYEGGYFWGVASVLLTPDGEEPNAEHKTDSTFLASITPAGQVHITFITGVSTTIGAGELTTHRGAPSFAMQMSTGPSSAMVVHWAYMLQVKPGDPEWNKLPGAEISVEAMVGDIEAPNPADE
jgi:hypothetical protein